MFVLKSVNKQDSKFTPLLRRHFLAQHEEMLKRKQPVLMYLPEVQIQFLVHILSSNEVKSSQLITQRDQQSQGLHAHLSLLELSGHHSQGLLLLGNHSTLGLHISKSNVTHGDIINSRIPLCRYSNTYCGERSFRKHANSSLDGIHHRLLLSSNPSDYSSY